MCFNLLGEHSQHRLHHRWNQLRAHVVPEPWHHGRLRFDPWEALPVFLRKITMPWYAISLRNEGRSLLKYFHLKPWEIYFHHQPTIDMSIQFTKRGKRPPIATVQNRLPPKVWPVGDFFSQISDATSGRYKLNHPR